jgi:hypothetical protein
LVIGARRSFPRKRRPGGAAGAVGEMPTPHFQSGPSLATALKNVIVSFLNGARFQD